MQHIRQTVQMGPLHISTGDSVTSGIHALQTVSGYYVRKLEEETITYDENDTTTTYGGEEYQGGTLFGAIGEALLGPNRFIADVKVTAKVEAGISIGAGCTFFMNEIWAEIVDGDKTKVGGFSKEEFHLSGRTYEKQVK
jgi:hypothetical protein